MYEKQKKQIALNRKREKKKEREQIELEKLQEEYEFLRAQLDYLKLMNGMDLDEEFYPWEEWKKE